MSFPYNRNRRLRKDSSIRAMVQENRLHASNFIVPLFVMEGQNTKEEISSMPGYFRYTIDLLIEEARECFQLGIRSALIFAKVENDLKDNSGNEALNPDGLMQRSIKALKENVPQMYLMSDVALDPYSEYGHDGIVEDNKIVNDKTIILLADIAVSHAQAGVDMVAPSDMMDGRILAIREALEDNDFVDVGIMSYSVKYASSFYGPFRDALDSSPGFGDKKTYQIDQSNSWEGISEVEQDMEEGADIIMIKPGMPYLDMVRHTRNNFDVTISVYQVSGEYAMIKAASQKGWLNHDEAMMESLIGFKRAGANLIATYFAKEAAKFLNNE
tara:strand:+ start:1376 stop:2359 length:984 start_codon:yes stop_codon:yes gene_type:complete